MQRLIASVFHLVCGGFIVERDYVWANPASRWTPPTCGKAAIDIW